jgi:hypothetical protein
VLHGRVLRGTWAVAAGLLTEQQLRSSAWRRLRRDVYADATIPVDHRLMARGVSLVMPRSAALGGRTAAVLWQLSDLASADDPVEVVVPPGTRWTPGPGVVVRSARLDGDVVHDGRGLRWTDRVRTAVDLIRRDDGDESVVLLDRLVYERVVGLADVREAVAALPRCRGRATAVRTAALADGLAESPPETRLRLLLHRSGLPLPVAQYLCGWVAGSSPGWTSPGRSAGSRWSTTATGTVIRNSSRRTGSGSTGSAGVDWRVYFGKDPLPPTTRKLAAGPCRGPLITSGAALPQRS